MQDSTVPNALLSKRGVTGPWEYSIDNHFDTTHFNFDNWVESGAGTVYGKDPLKTTVPLLTNKWHHIAYVADGHFLRAYFDGQLLPHVDTAISGKFFGNTNASLKIGNGGNWGKNIYFTGAIDDVYMYHRALNAQEIYKLAK